MGKGNRGAATVEACIVLPVFLYFLLAVVKIYMMLMAEAHIHQSLAEASSYTAQYCYLEQRLLKESGAGGLVDTAVLAKEFKKYLGEDVYVGQVIRGGPEGILLSFSRDKINPKIFYARAHYRVKLSVPIFGEYDLERSSQIKQKAFLGWSREERSDCYVYITPNQAVYHSRRNCTHLALQVREQGNTGTYKPCGFCGKETGGRGRVYVARTGAVYHSNRNCIGLKRSVTRIRQSETGGLGPCQRCGK